MNYLIKMPNFDVNEDKALITDIYVDNESYIKESTDLFAIETTKATDLISSESGGYVLLQCGSYEEKKTGDILAIIFDTLEELNDYKSNEKERDEKTIEECVNATDKAKSIAEQSNVDLKKLALELNKEFITSDDVLKYVNQKQHDTIPVAKNVFQYDRERVVIIGAGKGAEVVIDILLDDYGKNIVGLVDDKVKRFETYDYPMLNCTIQSFADTIERDYYDTVIISIGATLATMQFRQKIYSDYSKKDIIFTNAIARDSEIRRNVAIGVGNIIGARSYIGTMTTIGNNNSIGYGTYIGHHNQIGSHNLIAPGFFSSGSVAIGDSCVLPAGVITRNRVKVGNRVVVPVGYAITADLPDGEIIKQQY